MSVKFNALNQYERLGVAQLAAELARRRMESLKLYVPLPHLEPFHSSIRRERLIRGSNRAGKTLPSAVEVARALTGQDHYKKYPLRDGRAVAVGKDEREIGEVMWRKLARAGAFKIIRDPETNDWRAWQPWREYDDTHRHLAKLAPPLLPQRLIEHIKWKDKKRGVPDKVVMKTGWEILFISSKAVPIKGADIDLAWFSEEIVNEHWYDEITARLFDRGGRFIWDVTPEAATEQLYRLHERAEAGDPDVDEFRVLLADNPHFTDVDRARFSRQISPEMAVAKIHGEYLIKGYRVFPEFDMDLHGVDAFPIPEDWAMFMLVDPGHQVCGVVFGAMPPPDHELGKFVYITDERYIEKCSAEIFADAVAPIVSNRIFESFLIDKRNAVAHDVGSGRTIQDQYARALQKRSIRSRRTGSNFEWGTIDVKGSLEATHQWLAVREDGTIRLKIFRGMTPHLENELKHYHYQRKNGVLQDMPVNRNDHMVWGLRAFAAYDPKYVKPKRHSEYGPAWRAFQRKQQRKREANGKPFVQLGPPL